MFVADFMGSPAMNLIPATIAANGNALAVEDRARRAASRSRCRWPTRRAAWRPMPGKQVIFGIRPEALTDPDGADRNASSVATAECLIEVVEPAGSDTFAVTNLGGKEVVARLRADANIAAGRDDAARLQPRQGGVLRSGDASSRIDLTPDGAAPDIVIIGSGIGGATIAAGLAGSGAAILILERGEQLRRQPGTRATPGRSSSTATTARRRCGATAGGAPFNPGNYYYVGGNSKFYGAVLFRYRERGFRRDGACRRRLAGLAVSL